MLRQSPSRNQRAANAFKVKHALQVFILLAICMWVLYQVRHKEGQRKDVVGDVFQDEGSGGERMKFGRKELRPRPENLGREEKEDEPGEDFEEMEVEGRGVGDDEIDGNDQETAEEGNAAAEEADAADESREDFGDKEDKETEDRDYYPRDESSAAEKDQSVGEEKEDQANGILQDQRKGNVASDARSSYSGS